MSSGYNNVVHLEPSDFNGNQLTGVNQPFLIAVVANWCGHCKNMKQVWEQLASEYPMRFFAVESTSPEGEQVAKMLGVRGFPTIMMGDASGKIIGQHQGGRDRNSLMMSAKLQ